MTLDEFRQLTEGMPGDSTLVIMNTLDREVHSIDDVSVSRPSLLMPVIYLEADIW